MELTIQKFAEEIVCTKQFPRCGITLIVQHICLDGANVAVCLNAVWLALLDSGIPMSATVLSMGVALSATDGLLLDPTSDEEQNSVASCVVSIDLHSAEVLSVHPLRGAMPAVTWSAAVCAAQAGCKALENFVRTACEKRMEKLPVTGY